MSLNKLNEFSNLNQFINLFKRSPMQTHLFFHSDAEVIKISDENYLALSLDIVGDEQAWGLVTDAENLGRHALETALSDLAAVGVIPKGFLQGLIIDRHQEPVFVEKILAGINDVCKKHDLFLYGGDTASGQSFSLHLTVLGHSNTKPISRLGMNAGDIVYSTSLAGKGNALVAERWLSPDKIVADEAAYLAKARVHESQIVKKYATAMIDSSDGFLNSLDLLMRVNDKGISCTKSLDSLLHPLASDGCKKYGLSPWTLLAGEFGDYELIFSIPSTKAKAFETEYNQNFSGLTLIGEVIPTAEIQLQNKNKKTIAYDATLARNMYRQHSHNQKAYMKSFLELGQSLGF
jgi:thiamine-monophosphate kinase